MSFVFNPAQRESLSSFFNNIAVAWFVGLFVVPKLTPDFDALTVLRFLGNMAGALILSLLFLREDV